MPQPQTGALCIPRAKRQSLGHNQAFLYPSPSFKGFANGSKFQLRFCPSLAKKPTDAKLPGGSTLKKKTNPFENPVEDLFITEVPVRSPTHVLVLNKFPIISDHFILATSTFKSQTDELEIGDFKVTYQILNEWEAGGGGRLFAFFNCGPESGASQPHRHLQFLPVSSILEGDTSEEWKLLVDDLLERPVDVPFSYFKREIVDGVDEKGVHSLYKELLEESKKAWMGSRELKNREASTSVGFSYNLGMTTRGIVLCPRVAESAVLKRDGEGDIGSVAANGTILGGTLMVKQEEEWVYLKETKGGLDEVLDAIGNK